jgi:hypothetical protein
VVDSACLHPRDATAGGSRGVAGARYELC